MINIRRPTDSELNDDGAVESEDTSSEGSQLKPWDPMEIRITTKNFTVREVYIQMVEKEIDLAPDFQRDFVWKVQQQTRLIESILLGIPLPAFYFSQDELGQYDVIDGVQRLTTIKQFMSDILNTFHPQAAILMTRSTMRRADASLALKSWLMLSSLKPRAQ